MICRNQDGYTFTLFCHVFSVSIFSVNTVVFDTQCPHTHFLCSMLSICILFLKLISLVSAIKEREGIVAVFGPGRQRRNSPHISWTHSQTS